MRFNLNDISIITFKGVDCRCIIHDIVFIHNKSETIHLLQNSVLDIVGIYKMHINGINIKNHICNCYFNNSIKGKKLGTKNILIREKL